MAVMSDDDSIRPDGSGTAPGAEAPARPRRLRERPGAAARSGRDAVPAEPGDPSAPAPGAGSALPRPRGARRAGDIERGVAVIQGHLRTLPNAPGVYRMLDGGGEALYVGKARSLKKRVTSYTQVGKHPARLMRMNGRTEAIEFVVTELPGRAAAAWKPT